MKHILFFSKSKNLEHRYLSNFQIVDEGFIIDDTFIFKEMIGRKYHSIENAFQASKLCCAVFERDSLDKMEKISPLEAKRYGSKANFKKCKMKLDVDEWNRVSTPIMKHLLMLRYNHDHLFRKLIEDTKEENVILCHFERSGEKSYWGGYFKDGQWKGKNMLGKLMQQLKK
jgi:predicted NAD-dependent protein-ADP-ribosyltransferase YbiA (DUF1768 family)